MLPDPLLGQREQRLSLRLPFQPLPAVLVQRQQSHLAQYQRPLVRNVKSLTIF